MAVAKKSKRIGLDTIQFGVALALKHLRLIVLLMCFATSLGLAFYVVKRPVYEARALFRIRSEGRVLTQEEFFKDTEFYTILRAMQDSYLLERTAALFGIEAEADFIRKRYFKRIRARALPFAGQPNEKEIEVRVYAYSPELARQWLDKGFVVYYEERARRRHEDRLRIIEESRREMARMQAEMRAYAAKQDAFRERADWDGVTAEWDEYEGVPRRMEEIQRQLTNLASMREVLDNEALTPIERLSILAVRSLPRSGPAVGQIFEREPPFLGDTTADNAGAEESAPAVSSGESGSPPGVESFADSIRAARRFVVLPGMVGGAAADGWEVLYQERLLLQAERADLGKLYLSGHPKMRSVMARLASVEGELERRFAGIKRRVDWQQFILEQERDELLRKQPKFEEVRGRYQDLMAEFTQLNYGQQPWSEKYNELLQRMSIARMQLDYGIAAPEPMDIEFLGYTQTPDLPVSPHRAKLLVFCLFLGIVMSTAAVVAGEYFDQTIGMVESAEQHLGLRGLGIVPLVPHHALPAGRHILIDGLAGDKSHQRSLVETFRSIRANLLASESGGDAKQVIMVTSSLPREGKSAVSMNLAVTLAKSGKRILLIDADARRGRLQRELGNTSAPGLADVLTGRAKLEEACTATRYENLDLLGTGRISTGLPELLTNRKFSEMIATLRTQYDHILIDTPPVLGLSEACDLLPCVDGVVLVVWAKYTPLREVKASVSLLQRNGANFLGFVMNRVDLTNASYYYHYYYYSDYYYRSYERQKSLPEHDIVVAPLKEQ